MTRGHKVVTIWENVILAIHSSLRYMSRSIIITMSPTSNIRVLSPTKHLCSESLHSRPRDDIADQVVVDIDQDTRVSPLVESRRARTAGSL
jgi:hypothetical protein